MNVPNILYPNTKSIPLSQDKYTIVDTEDYDWLMQWKWYFGGKQYAVRMQYCGMLNGKSKLKMICMHRLILDTPSGMFTDHVNGNRLDNRRSNLRICTRQQNAYNQMTSKGSSIYKGVTWNKNAEKWQAQIRYANTNYYLGCFTDEVKAACAYNDAAVRLHRSFARLNDTGIKV
jgi:hypothetical protein